VGCPYGHHHVSENTKPAGADGSRYGTITPPEIVEVALANAPQWLPQINDSIYPRTSKLKTSI